MFEDHQINYTEFISSWKEIRSTQNNESQTENLLTDTAEAQIPEKSEVEVQTDEIKDENHFNIDNINNPELISGVLQFLNKVTDVMCAQLEKNSRSHAFDCYTLSSDPEYGNTDLKHTLVYEPLLKESEFQCSDLSWNSTGTLLAVGYSSVIHDDWCTHDSAVCLWNLHRRDFNSRKPNTVIETDCCLTSLSFHSNLAPVLAGGKFSGEIVVWNTGREDDLTLATTGAVTDSHHEAITGLYWIPTHQDQLSFISTSLDGKILFWKVNDRNQSLEIKDGFILLADHLPRNLGVKSTYPDSEVGITSMSLNSEDPSICLIATEGGGVIQGSFNTQSVAGYGASSFTLKNPVVMSFTPHQGYIGSIQSSPHTRNLFLTCGSDGELRIYSLLQSKPVLTIQSSVGFQKSWWSVVRPLVISTITANGELQIYDLQASCSTPVSSLSLSQNSCLGTALQFNPQSFELLASGTSDGKAQVWQLGNQLVASGVQEVKKLNDIAKITND
ncbi:cytoplasmic dynein 2 intermediate chain 2-like [Tachypleus tridentatus]|uniref:cytoplasmic dynein 2 intermediate chain 2-like n=1 Tax=Tachypleus tridentatus TaxID=6853 RepID=UPI003FD34F31